MEDIAVIVQSGAVGIAGGALWILYKVLTNHNHHTNEVIDKNTDALQSISVIMEKHNNVVEKLCEKLDQK